MFNPISAKRLLNVRLSDASGEVRRVILFPMFDSLGHVFEVLVIDNNDMSLLVFDPNRSRFTFRWIAPHQISDILMPLRSDRLIEFTRRWHFDPWWLLATEEWSDRPEQPLIKATNCVRSFSTEVKMVYFSRDLTKLKYIHKKNNNTDEIARLRPGDLPDKPSTESLGVPMKARSGSQTWRLRPSWKIT